MATTTLNTAACRTHKSRGELWFSDNGADRALAIHICLNHCPLLAACLDANTFRAHGVWAGTLYSVDGQPDSRKQIPSARDCTQCPADELKPTTVFDDCGQYKAYQRHLRLGEKPCQRCTRANSKREARHRETLRELGPRSRAEWAAEKKSRAQLRDEARAALADKVRTLAGYGLMDREIGERLTMPEYTVRRIRRNNDIPAGSKATAAVAA